MNERCTTVSSEWVSVQCDLSASIRCTLQCAVKGWEPFSASEHDAENDRASTEKARPIDSSCAGGIFRVTQLVNIPSVRRRNAALEALVATAGAMLRRGGDLNPSTLRCLKEAAQRLNGMRCRVTFVMPTKIRTAGGPPDEGR